MEWQDTGKTHVPEVVTRSHHRDTEQSFVAFTNDKQDVAVHLLFREIMVSKPNKIHLIPMIVGVDLKVLVCSGSKIGENLGILSSFWVN